MADKIILLVEDNPDDEALTIRSLRHNNVLNNVVVARDGVEALDYLFCRGEYSGRNAGDMPEIVLLDLKLPKVDGFEVLEAIRGDERTRLLPVVILTSSSEEEDVVRGYNHGANSSVPKPVGFEEFCSAVRQLGLYWVVLNEPMPGQGR